MPLNDTLNMMFLCPTPSSVRGDLEVTLHRGRVQYPVYGHLRGHKTSCAWCHSVLNRARACVCVRACVSNFNIDNNFQTTGPSALKYYVYTFFN